jgi:imidazoleglycerol-phosphate dehydratase
MNKHLTFRRKHLHTWKNFILTTFERSMVIIMSRNAKVERKTNETDIILELDLDGTGKGMIETGIGFLNHMLDNFTRHGFFDLNLVTNGDLHVDAHHTVEDTGIVLGQAIRNALGDKKGIKRYGNAIIPMDETLVLCALDLSGRPYLVFDLPLTAEKVGYMETELVKEFFYAISYSAGMNLHIKLIHGSNNHHIIEAAFKAFAKALDQAVQYDERIEDVLSTKGTVD